MNALSRNQSVALVEILPEGAVPLLMGKVGSLGDQDAYSISINMISENLTTSSTLDSVGLQKPGPDIGNNR